MVQIVDFASHKISFNPLGLSSNQEQIQPRTTTNPYFALRLAPNPLIQVSSHYPLLHPPTNSFWYIERLNDCQSYLPFLAYGWVLTHGSVALEPKSAQ